MEFACLFRKWLRPDLEIEKIDIINVLENVFDHPKQTQTKIGNRKHAFDKFLRFAWFSIAQLQSLLNFLLDNFLNIRWNFIPEN